MSHKDKGKPGLGATERWAAMSNLKSPLGYPANQGRDCLDAHLSPGTKGPFLLAHTHGKVEHLNTS